MGFGGVSSFSVFFCFISFLGSWVTPTRFHATFGSLPSAGFFENLSIIDKLFDNNHPFKRACPSAFPSYDSPGGFARCLVTEYRAHLTEALSSSPVANRDHLHAAHRTLPFCSSTRFGLMVLTVGRTHEKSSLSSFTGFERNY